MKPSLKQHGFSVVETLLILVIIGLLGVSGYYVFNAKKNADKSLNNAASQEQKLVSSSTKQGEYQNKDFGFKFEYPKEWGAVKTVSSEGERGVAYSLTFANKENYYAAFTTKDYYQASPEGRGGGCNGGSGLFPNDKLDKEMQNKESFYEIKVNELDLKVVFSGTSYIAPDTGCPLKVGGMKLLSEKNKVNTIFFFYDKYNQFKDETDIARYYENPIDFYSETEQNIFMGIMRSIKKM